MTYTPNAGFNGLDRFTYTVTDSEGVTSTAKVTVKVAARPTIFIDDVTVLEGQRGTRTPAVFTVTLSGAQEIPVTFDYATRNRTAVAAGDGVANADYVQASGTLVFEPGETSKSITVWIIGENVHDPKKTFNVELSNVINATVAFGKGVGTIR